MFMTDSTKRIHYIRAWRRRWGFQISQSFVAIKEYRSRENSTPALSFIVALSVERTPEEIERLVRAEVLKRIQAQS
jgi:hypothetical protein